MTAFLPSFCSRKNWLLVVVVAVGHSPGRKIRLDQKRKWGHVDERGSGLYG